MLCSGYADRQGKADLGTYALADCRSYLGRVSEESDGSGHVEEGLVNRYPFDPRREVMKYRNDFVAEFLVAGEVASHKEEVSAELTGLPARHPAAHAEAPRFVRRCEDDAAAHRNGAVAQRRVQ
jgi:hypothetical protein